MMKFYKTALFGIVLLFLAQQHTGCKESITDYDREKVRLDSLHNMLVATEVALNVDEKVMQHRINLIDSWYIKLSDTTYDVAKKMQVEFNGFKVVYKKYIDGFFFYASALDLHKQQYKMLEEKVKKQELSRSEFKDEYEKLKAGIVKNYKDATTLAQPVYDLELSWKRHERTMENMGSSRR